MIIKYILICIAISSYVSQFNSIIMIARTLTNIFPEHTPNSKSQNQKIQNPYTAQISS